MPQRKDYPERIKTQSFSFGGYTFEKKERASACVWNSVRRGGRNWKDVGLVDLKYWSRLREELKQPSFSCQADRRLECRHLKWTGVSADYGDSQKRNG